MTRSSLPTQECRPKARERARDGPSPAPSGSGGAVLKEPLSGTFTVESRQRYNCDYPNELLCFEVTAVQFQSPHFAVTASAGWIIQSSFTPEGGVFISLTTFINGESVILNGAGPLDADANEPPPFRALKLCGAPPGLGGSCEGIRSGTDVGYDLTISAEPESGH
jgi:hypothetical protein